MAKVFFNVPVQNKEEISEKVIEMSKNYDYTTGNSLDYKYFANYCKFIAINLSKQTELENPDLKQQINFTDKIEENNATMFFIIDKHKRLQICWMILKNLNLLQKCYKQSDSKR